MADAHTHLFSALSKSYQLSYLHNNLRRIKFMTHANACNACVIRYRISYGKFYFSSYTESKTRKVMVNVTKGILVECDAAMKQFLLHLDETFALGRKFIIQDLDERHLFVSADILETLQAKVDDLMDQISFPLAEKGI